MSNKIAIVTGGTKGIGKAISLELVKNNYHVYICARDNKGLEKRGLDFRFCVDSFIFFTQDRIPTINGIIKYK